MFEGFDSGPGWGDETDENEPPPPWYVQVLGLVIVAAVIWVIYGGIKSL
jgi:hypothetical protein